VKKTRRLSIGQQILGMRSYFPEFKYYRSKAGPTWKGWIHPSDQSAKYLFKMTYDVKKSPSVWILTPKIDQAPHRYSNQSLCLYYLKDRSWTPDKLLAKYIIPWTAEWLVFYEIWLKTGIWYGEEAPHEGSKKSPSHVSA